MKKKVITAILLSCVSISCLFGCGEQNTQADNTTDKDKGKYHFEIIVQTINLLIGRLLRLEFRKLPLISM